MGHHEDGSGPWAPLEGITLVNLSHVHDPATTCLFPGDPPFTLETVATIPDDGYHLQYVRMGEHTGTHWGAPGHFTAGEALADELDPNDLFLPAVKIDMRDRCAGDPDYALTVADLRDFERAHGRIPDGAAVIMWTGWETRWGTDAFHQYDAGGARHQPGFSMAALRWLVDTGRLGRNGALGTDTFGPDLGTDTSYAVSRLLYRRRRISLEILANLASLPATGAYVLCGGQINRNGSGSTAIIYGVLPPPG
ncbi:cyclase family protein [Krasilnikovia sp. M28-CT-15]|uniref:cyclase family protein n=1 Tax=Krasilnikovia sp. M28-CT-15 TaxID=3373540 RepID=UPI003876C16F